MGEAQALRFGVACARFCDALLAVLLAPACAACNAPLDHPTRGPVCSTLLAVDSPADPATLRWLRRSPADVANDQHAAGPVRTMPAHPPARRSIPRDRRVRGGASIHRPRAEVRRAAIACRAAGRIDARSRQGPSRRGRRRRRGAAPPVAAKGARVQPGRRSRAAAARPGLPALFDASAQRRRSPACRPGVATGTCAAPFG